MADTHASGACAFFKREGSTPFLRIAKIGSIISVVGKTTVEIMELFECRQKVP